MTTCRVCGEPYDDADGQSLGGTHPACARRVMARRDRLADHAGRLLAAVEELLRVRKLTLDVGLAWSAWEELEAAAKAARGE